MTRTPEMTIVMVALIVILTAYFLVYPRMVKSDVIKLAIFDIVSASTTIIVSGFIFWNSHIAFDLYLIDVNWFIYSIVCYAFMEIPFMIWYFIRFRVWESFS